ncbi:hypothetical protein GJR99_08295 [Haloferax sp. MBLA0078]|uniref:Uncharacterized protein n=2 Tax=Haloferacaceae TaxID=1644056 RepID=A0A6A8G5N6_9EURY|nr:hypothetical protein Hfx1150_08335 [Haloferax sp. CBA1150]MRW96570.1 hypothetical protein [Haloferax marinum]
MATENEPARSVLVLCSDIDSPPFGLSGVQNPRLLAVDFTPRSTGDRVYWENRLGVRPAELAVITTETRDSDAVSADEVDQVTSPADLTGLGMKATKHLSRWESEGEPHDEPTTPIVVFDSLTILFQYAGLRPIFKFVHTLTTRVANVDGYGVFFLDPLTQDDKTVHTLSSVFDAIARRQGDEWDVLTR